MWLTKCGLLLCQARIDYYERGTYFGKPASGILYGLAHAMHLDDNRLLWYVMPPSACECWLAWAARHFLPPGVHHCAVLIYTSDILHGAAARLYIIGVTDQLVHQHVAKDRYLQTCQMLETEVRLEWVHLPYLRKPCGGPGWLGVLLHA
jgi:hypothetical protein